MTRLGAWEGCAVLPLSLRRKTADCPLLSAAALALSQQLVNLPSTHPTPTLRLQASSW